MSENRRNHLAATRGEYGNGILCVQRLGVLLEPRRCSAECHVAEGLDKRRPFDPIDQVRCAFSEYVLGVESGQFL